MTFIAILLFVMAGWNVLKIFLLPLTLGAEVKTHQTPGRVAFASFVSMLTAVVFILAGLGLTGAFG